MHENNIDVTNPEDLLEGEIELSQMFDDFISVRELAQILNKAPTVNIGKILVEYGDVLPDNEKDGIGKLLTQKVYNATPGELQDICDEARGQGVWHIVSRSVMERNNKHARAVYKCQSLASFDMMLEAIVSPSGWLPSPVYHTAGKVLERFVEEADKVSVIDEIQDMAYKWNFLGQIRKFVAKKDDELRRAARRHRSTHGYRVRSGTRHELITSAAEALRKVESGEWVFED
jgi:hypothetical protein